MLMGIKETNSENTINTLRPEQNYSFVDNIFMCIFWEQKILDFDSWCSEVCF